LRVTPGEQKLGDVKVIATHHRVFTAMVLIVVPRSFRLSRKSLPATDSRGEHRPPLLLERSPRIKRSIPLHQAVQVIKTMKYTATLDMIQLRGSLTPQPLPSSHRVKWIS